MKIPSTVRFSERTRNQLEQLASWWEVTMTEVLARLIEKAYASEKKEREDD